MTENTTVSAPSSLIDRITERIVRRFCPTKIILFGSYAYGYPRAESDIDILVVTTNLPEPQETWRIAAELTERGDPPVQLAFMHPKEFEETKDVVGGLAYPASHKGIVLYEANP